MSKLLALDQSSRITGWSVFDSGQLIQHGKFELTSNDIDQRLVQFKNQIKSLIYQYKIDEVIYEDIQLQNNVINNVQTFKILAEIYGILSELLAEMRLPHTSILASQWKSSLHIKGRTRPEQKRNAQQYILNEFNIKATQDEVDSICIGLHHIQQNKNNWSE